MTVRVNKPAINVREELADLRKPTGIAGEAMLRADTPQEQQALIGVGRRNLIINGDFQVSQRGTTFTSSSDGWGVYGSVDRWGIYYNHTVVTQNSGLVDGSYQYYVSVDNDGTAPDNHFIYQKIETGSRIVSGKSVTLSFMAKSSNETVLKVRGRFYDSATESNGVDSGQKTFQLSSSWQRFEYTFTPVDTSANMTRDFLLIFDTDISTDTVNDSYDLTNVQLELGKVATPFEHRSYGEELALCQRYFQRYPSSAPADLGSYAGIGGFGNCISTTIFEGCIVLPVTMRIEPTMSPSASGAFRVYHENTNTVVTSGPLITDVYSSAGQVSIRATVGSAALTIGNGGQLQQSNDNDAHISLDSEL